MIAESLQNELWSAKGHKWIDPSWPIDGPPIQRLASSMHHHAPVFIHALNSHLRIWQYIKPWHLRQNRDF